MSPARGDTRECAIIHRIHAFSYIHVSAHIQYTDTLHTYIHVHLHIRAYIHTYISTKSAIERDFSPERNKPSNSFSCMSILSFSPERYSLEAGESPSGTGAPVDAMMYALVYK